MLHGIEKNFLFLHDKIKFILVGLGVCVLTVVLWFAYNWYSIYQAKQTQTILTDALDEYQKVVESNEPLWSEVVMMSDLGLTQAQFDAMKPYFMVMKSQALAHQHTIPEAVQTITDAQNMIADTVPYKNYYALTKSLMQLDAQDSGMKEEGLSQLKQLAFDETNMFRDAALYYLAEYYQINNELHEAANIMELLMDESLFKDSPWAAKIKETCAY